jgi:hypothetical protein
LCDIAGADQRVEGYSTFERLIILNWDQATGQKSIPVFHPLSGVREGFASSEKLTNALDRYDSSILASTLIAGFAFSTGIGSVCENYIRASPRKHSASLRSAPSPWPT